MLPTIHIGPLVIQVPGLLLLFGLWLGMSLAEKHSTRHGIQANHVYSFTIATLLCAAVSARLIYVIRNLDNFLNSPASIVSLNPGLLDPFGALLGSSLVLIIFSRRNKYNLWALLDALAPILAVLMITISLANLASGKGYGYPTRLPWAIPLFGASRHPTQIYELIAAGIVLAVLWPGNRRVQFQRTGVYALCVIAATAGCRLIFEAFRADSDLITGGLRSMQVTAWLVLAVSLWLISRRTRQDG